MCHEEWKQHGRLSTCSDLCRAMDITTAQHADEHVNTAPQSQCEPGCTGGHCHTNGTNAPCRVNALVAEQMLKAYYARQKAEAEAKAEQQRRQPGTSSEQNAIETDQQGDSNGTEPGVDDSALERICEFIRSLMLQSNR